LRPNLRSSQCAKKVSGRLICQIEQCDKRENGHVLERRSCDQLASTCELRDGDRRGDRRVLEHHDHRVAVGRKEHADRLRQHHAAHDERRPHPERLRGFDLAMIDGLDAGSEILGLVRRVRDAESDESSLERARADAEIGSTKYM
jgi:hypothetical protein